VATVQGRRLYLLAPVMTRLVGDVMQAHT
jgi:hypothetical protein